MVYGEASKPRDMETVELLGRPFTFDMNYPVLLNPLRKLGYRFMAGEAAWILSGSNRLNDVQDLSKAIEQFSDDGYMFAGAYGPQVIDQLMYVVKNLSMDASSRQAVLTIWRPNPRDGRDIPCTVAMQWLIRADRLHCLVTMRSSDGWLGIPYDAFNFTCITMLVGMLINKNRGVGLKLGNLRITPGSAHLYEKNWDGVRKCLDASVFIPSAELYQNTRINTDYWYDQTDPFELTTYLRLATAPDHAREFVHDVFHHDWLMDLYHD
jgi:thymidylate synthase